MIRPSELTRSKLFTLFLLVGVLARGAAAATCNGHAALCDRRYSNITFIGSHDSAFVGTGLADNQLEPIDRQLASGIRFLQIQTHDSNGTIELCHTLCLLEDAGTLSGYLGTVKTFLDSNPEEVITLLLTNPDKKTGIEFNEVFQGAGVDVYAFVPPGNLTLDTWPTLGEMVGSGKRLVVFMDYLADKSVPYILDEFNSFMFETPFDTTDPVFPQCNIDRPSGASPAGRMSLVNHFLDTNTSGLLIPDRSAAETTNSAASIMAQVNICTGLYNRNPNFILLDWISIGDAITVQDQLNGENSTQVSTPANQTSENSGQTGGSQQDPSKETGGQGPATDSVANSLFQRWRETPSNIAVVLACTILFMAI
ncbi:PLC-like phosphodiesterase [Pseudomassariella vexata]|uniref:PLC-like phosphodiesterase n=1 Tax=Pseudomassariella vexata TaxID=1141098 RepID=A0A1Y2DHA4_9PEZI|nr:PLC-like phosphodiesterase [Pseudomassariella vexata]ORY58506.1 PLC-like phosphodiesterase [Pseudomassariella vexata]